MTKEKFTEFDPAELLTDEKVIAEYLNMELANGDPKYIKIALNNIARARNMSELARRAGMPRASIYRALNPDSNAEYDTIQKIVNALGMRFVVQPVPTTCPVAI